MNKYNNPLEEIVKIGVARSIYTIKWMLYGAVIGSSFGGPRGALVGGSILGAIGVALDEGILRRKELLEV